MNVWDFTHLINVFQCELYTWLDDFRRGLAAIISTCLIASRRPGPSVLDPDGRLVVDDGECIGIGSGLAVKVWVICSVSRGQGAKVGMGSVKPLEWQACLGTSRFSPVSWGLLGLEGRHILILSRPKILIGRLLPRPSRPGRVTQRQGILCYSRRQSRCVPLGDESVRGWCSIGGVLGKVLLFSGIGYMSVSRPAFWYMPLLCCCLNTHTVSDFSRPGPTLGMLDVWLPVPASWCGDSGIPWAMSLWFGDLSSWLPTLSGMHLWRNNPGALDSVMENHGELRGEWTTVFWSGIPDQEGSDSPTPGGIGPTCDGVRIGENKGVGGLCGWMGWTDWFCCWVMISVVPWETWRWTH